MQCVTCFLIYLMLLFVFSLTFSELLNKFFNFSFPGLSGLYGGVCPPRAGGQAPKAHLPAPRADPLGHPPALRRKQRLGLLCPADGRGGHLAGRGGSGLCPGRHRRRLRRPPGPLVRDGGAHRHGPLFGLCHRPPAGPSPAAGLTAAQRGGEEELL